MPSINKSLPIVALGLVMMGCTSLLRNRQLENVAKDWSMAIRASQIIPVYPPTEDLQPGDVLLVGRPVEDRNTYRTKGFLPLDQFLVRLHPEEYPAFYKPLFGVSDNDPKPPALWWAQNWENAPCAAFPTYQFEINTSSGFNLALPVHGIPLALGLLNAGKAAGSVTIPDAHTYGLDIVGLQKKVQEWAAKPGTRQLLAAYAPREDGGHQFLRVVTRVYVANAVDVSLTNLDTTGGQASAASGQPVNLLTLLEDPAADDPTAKAFASVTEAVNKLAIHPIPGGTASGAATSFRSISWKEKFSKPLVIGYLGFDMPIFKGGRLGAPISTLAQITQPGPDPLRPMPAHAFRLDACAALSQFLSSTPETKDSLAKLDRLASSLPDAYPFGVYRAGQSAPAIDTGSPVKKQPGFQSFLDFLGNAEATIQALQSVRHPNAREQADLQAAQEAYDKHMALLMAEPGLQEAFDTFLGH